MPCYDERTSPSYMQAEFDVERRRLQDKVNNLTRLLCSTCRTIDKNGGRVSDLGLPELDKWWKQHQIQDKLHEAADRAVNKRKSIPVGNTKTLRLGPGG